MEKPLMIRVESSRISSIGYSAEDRALYIDFKRGGSYKYTPVTEQGFEDLKNAESIGKFFGENIVNNSLLTTERL